MNNACASNFYFQVEIILLRIICTDRREIKLNLILIENNLELNVIKLMLIGIGGFIGAILRYSVSGLMQNLSGSINFPFGTLAVNIVGCFFIGLFSYLIEVRAMFTVEVRAFLLIGVLGSFTTFSTFGHETYNHFLESKFHLVGFNVGAHLMFGLLAVYLGRITSFAIWR